MADSLEKISEIIDELLLDGYIKAFPQKRLHAAIIVHGGLDKRTKRKYRSSMEELDLIEKHSGNVWKWKVSGFERYFDEKIDDLDDEIIEGEALDE